MATILRSDCEQQASLAATHDAVPTFCPACPARLMSVAPQFHGAGELVLVQKHTGPD